MGGAGFDGTEHGGLREGIRGVIGQASFGAASPVDLDAIAGSLGAPGFDHAWQSVTCVENHDIVKAGTGDSSVTGVQRSEEHTSELQSHLNLVCRLLLEKKTEDLSAS